jgi:cytochrome c-type biogenesis protein CcmH
MTLWIATALLCALALAFVLPPLLRAHRHGTPARDAFNTTIHRARLAELDADLAAGTLDARQAEQARADLARDLLHDAQSDTPLHGGRAWKSALVVAVLVPTLALGLYARSGAWRNLETTAATPAVDEQRVQIEAMTAKLVERLKQEPENVEGWQMLGRAYGFTQRHSEAAAAYAEAYALSDAPGADLLADYAEMLGLAHGESLAGAPEKLIARALRQTPDHAKSLWLAGLAALQRDDFKSAITHWQQLEQRVDPASEQARLLANYLQTARAGLAGKPAATADDTPPASASTRLKVEIKLDPRLAARTSPEDTVFIFARAAEGPPMPLASARHRVRDLPLTLTLDDSMAMMPELKLSKFSRVIVGARISKSGQPTASSGDIQGLSPPVANNTATPILLTLDQVVP